MDRARLQLSLFHSPLKGHETLRAIAQLLNALPPRTGSLRGRILLGHLHADGLALVADQHRRRRRAQLGQVTRFLDGRLQIAQFIDQSMPQRLLARPDAAAADSVNLVGKICRGFPPRARGTARKYGRRWRGSLRVARR